MIINTYLHTIQDHPTNEVKLRKCELSTSTEKCGYRTLNFKIIPSELESPGKKICFFKFISFPCSIYVIATVSMFVEQWEQVGGEFTITAFKIIPSELESPGKKICVDDHGSVFTKAVIVNSPPTCSHCSTNMDTVAITQQADGSISCWYLQRIIIPKKWSYLLILSRRKSALVKI
jgi:hypothetical protein